METNFSDEFSKEIYEQTYKINPDTCIGDTLDRVAGALADLESDRDLWFDKFRRVLHGFKFVPGGRVISNAGTGIGGTSLINCFTSGPSPEDGPVDSMEGILSELRRQALTLKSEGGYGFCCDFMRPRGAFVEGIAAESPGTVSMLDMWDTQSAVITKGSGQKSTNKKAKGKIRKGAQMVTMSCWHPAMEEFVTAKRTPGKLTKFNMSVLITDDFMNAVKNNLPWDLVFPDLDEDKVTYDADWDGNINRWIAEGGSVKVYKSYSNANELWDLIMDSTYKFNDPGVLFVDTINKMDNLDEYISTTNPCVVEGTLVNTPTGMIPVEQVSLGQMISTLHPNGSEPVKEIEKHEDCDVFKVTFSDGGEQTVTAAHIYHVFRKGSQSKLAERIRLDQVQIGDYVQVSPAELTGSICVDSPEYRRAELAGVLVGDGCYSEKTMARHSNVAVSFDSREDEYFANVGSLVEELGYSLNKEDKTKGDNATRMRIKGGRDLVQSLDLAPATSENKSAPSEVFQSKTSIAGFLSGLLASDGNVNLTSNHPQVRWMTTSKELASQVRSMLGMLGIHGRITSQAPACSQIEGREIKGNHTKYTVNVSGMDLLALSRAISGLHPQKSEKLMYAVTRFNISGGTRKAEILSIEPAGKAKVYDLFCEESDTWITDGYVQQGCGEQPMSPHSICLLGSLNLTQFINNDRTDFDYDAITEAVPTIIRLMDNVNDIAYVPLPEQRESLAGKRRVGLGYMGYGSALMLLGVKYGSERALEITAKLCSHVANLAYQSSAKLAREKGPFPMQDLRRYLKSEFLKGLSPETLSMIKKYGTRNSHLLSVQPTGNTAIVANNVSGGLEPLFLPEYIRTVIVNSPPRGLKVPSSIDWSNNIDSLGEWNWTKEGDESLLRREMRGVVYKIDRNRGLTKEQLVCDYAVRILKEEDSWNPEADWAQTTTQLSVDDHVSTMAIFAKYCDAAISKTINVSNDTTYEDFKEIYMKAFDTGFVKGFTTYRAGTRTSVLAAVGENSQDDSTEDHIVVTKAPKRPKKLPCDIFSIASNNKKWTIIVGLLNGQPYEIFALESKELGLDKDISSGVLWKTSKKKYNLELDGEIVRDLQKFFKTDEQESITRLLSTSLRHGTPLTYLVSQMRKSGGTVVAYSKAIARVLSKYVKVSEEGSKEKCPSCGSDKYFFVEGCNKCSDCGYGACS